MPQVLYFARRVTSFVKDGVIPPSHLRIELKCDACGESCWANRENWRDRDKRYDHAVICDRCMQLGRHITG